MKKIMLCAFLFFQFVQSSAEYLVKIPLEVHNILAYVSWNGVIYNSTSGYYRGQFKPSVDGISYYVVCRNA